MIELSLDEVAVATDGRVAAGDGATTIRAVTTDSRRVPPQSLFVALAGENADGHDYVEDAIQAGAVGLLVERVPARPGAAVVEVPSTWSAIGRLGATVRDRVDPTVVAITGSVGKTTTKDLTAAALRAGRRTIAAEGSFNNELGVPLTLLALEQDTQALVVEMGARGLGHIAALTPLARPGIAIVTAVAAVHLELFGDIDTIARAKAELVEALPGSGTAVLNGDDRRVAAMAERTRAEVLTYGFQGVTAGRDLVAEEVVLDRVARASFRARTPWGDVDVRLPIAGRHHVGNALAALGAAGAAGVDVAAAAAAIGSATISAWRGEVHETARNVILNDAYNANPTSVAAAVDMLQSVERTGRTWAVLGVMAEIGADHDAEHERTGAATIAAGVDRLVVVGSTAAAMAAGAREALGEGGGELRGDRVVTVADADEALRLVAAGIAPGDVVLVKASRVGGLETVAEGLLERLGRRPVP